MHSLNGAAWIYSCISPPSQHNELTKMSIDTRHILVLVNGYDGDKMNTLRCAEYIAGLLRLHADGKDITVCNYD